MGKKLSEREIKKIGEKSKISLKFIALICTLCLTMVIIIVTAIIYNRVPDKDTFFTINGRNFTQTEYSVHYSYLVNNYLTVYEDYIDFLGLNLDIPFDEQIYDEETGETWFSFFCELTNASLQTTETLYNESIKNGYKPKNIIYNKFIEDVKAQAEKANRSYLNFLQTMFVKTITINIFEEQMYRYCTAVEYSEYLKDNFKNSITNEDLEEYYSKNSKFYDTVDYCIFNIPFDENLVEDEGNHNLTKETAKIRAENVAKASSVAEFQTFAVENTIEETKDSYARENATRTYMTAISSDNKHSDASKWLFDDVRKSGDTEIFEEDGRYFVIYFDDRYRNDNNTVTFRHIYLSTETYGDQETLDKSANALYEHWIKNGATENLFADYANEYSEITLDGGLYSNIGKGELIDILDKWLFDSDRISNDYTIIQDGIGYHILYFVKVDEPKWKASARKDYSDELYSNYINSKISENKIVYVTGDIYDSSNLNGEKEEILEDVLRLD